MKISLRLLVCFIILCGGQGFAHELQWSIYLGGKKVDAFKTRFQFEVFKTNFQEEDQSVVIQHSFNPGFSFSSILGCPSDDERCARFLRGGVYVREVVKRVIFPPLDFAVSAQSSRCRISRIHCQDALQARVEYGSYETVAPDLLALMVTTLEPSEDSGQVLNRVGLVVMPLLPVILFPKEKIDDAPDDARIYYGFDTYLTRGVQALIVNGQRVVRAVIRAGGGKVYVVLLVPGTSGCNLLVVQSEQLTPDQISALIQLCNQPSAEENVAGIPSEMILATYISWEAMRELLDVEEPSEGGGSDSQVGLEESQLPTSSNTFSESVSLAEAPENLSLPSDQSVLSRVLAILTACFIFLSCSDTSSYVSE